MLPLIIYEVFEIQAPTKVVSSRQLFQWVPSEVLQVLWWKTQGFLLVAFEHIRLVEEKYSFLILLYWKGMSPNFRDSKICWFTAWTLRHPHCDFFSFLSGDVVNEDVRQLCVWNTTARTSQQKNTPGTSIELINCLDWISKQGSCNRTLPKPVSSVTRNYMQKNYGKTVMKQISSFFGKPPSAILLNIEYSTTWWIFQIAMFDGFRMANSLCPVQAQDVNKCKSDQPMTWSWLWVGSRMNEIDLQLIDANVQRIEGEIIKQFLVLKYDPKCAVSNCAQLPLILSPKPPKSSKSGDDPTRSAEKENSWGMGIQDPSHPLLVVFKCANVRTGNMDTSYSSQYWCLTWDDGTRAKRKIEMSTLTGGLNDGPSAW